MILKPGQLLRVSFDDGDDIGVFCESCARHYEEHEWYRLCKDDMFESDPGHDTGCDKCCFPMGDKKFTFDYRGGKVIWANSEAEAREWFGYIYLGNEIANKETLPTFNLVKVEAP